MNPRDGFDISPQCEGGPMDPMEISYLNTHSSMIARERLVSNIEWFSKTVGGIPVQHDEETGESLLLFGGDIPDHVRLPTELGGQQVRVIRGFTARSPGPGRAHLIVRHLELEGGIFVAEDDQFYWYRIKPGDKDDGVLPPNTDEKEIQG